MTRPRKAPDLVEALAAMEPLDLHLCDSMAPHAFASMAKSKRELAGRRFRAFRDTYKGAARLFVVRVS